jgi:hypothetical protein
MNPARNQRRINMRYPVDVDKYVATSMSMMENPDDEGDKAIFYAMAVAMNKAYYAGLEEGRKEK